MFNEKVSIAHSTLNGTDLTEVFLRKHTQSLANYGISIEVLRSSNLTWAGTLPKIWVFRFNAS